ncbi:AhpC/TSA family protein [Pseudoflavitalea sp. G-6-1-2]|uniref:TlpA disulfide reductase family protein n=1 Tax=Pseudoflavitalea sp. G-6-1-2 TaxID=2728841 RepID=UPI00146AED93|nr:TlpA disulfide reductase family protein [Pseudoflavitalea sp. G-6-1-2]NML22378.1 AhpC/TSA family protein [Pseudoflavitalea sp. G-6-1-2]
MATFIGCSLFAQQPFVIKGKLSGLTNPAKLRLLITKPGGAIKDSVITRNGEFTFSGQIDEPRRAYLSLESVSSEAVASKDRLQFFAEPGEIVVKGSSSIANASIKGGKTNDEFQELQQSLQQLKENGIGAKGSKEQQADSRGLILQRQIELRDSFILLHPGSYVSLDLVAQKWLAGNLSELGKYYDALSETMKSSHTGRAILQVALTNRTGYMFPDFSVIDQDEKTIDLASLKGRYVFVDIWASWCKPCRAETPGIQRALEKFRSRNFDVLSISLDANRAAWLKAVNDDNMRWQQGWDMLSFQGKIALEFGINSVPGSFLLDPQGRVIARDLRGEELDRKLEEVLGKN